MVERGISVFKFKGFFKNKNRNLNAVICKRFNIISGLMVLIFVFILIKLVVLQISASSEYQVKLESLTVKTVKGASAPRGRILDRNHNVLVDNIGYKVIYYQKPKGITTKAELDLAYAVSAVLELPYSNLGLNSLKDFWLLLYKDAGKLKITKAEYDQYEKRKLTKTNLEELKRERITEMDLQLLKEADKKAAYLYYLMNNGYYYEEKVIKNKKVSDLEYAVIAESPEQFPGFNVKLDWERVYLYGDTLRQILGSVSTATQGVPYELKDNYLKLGYNLNDRVGISYLEQQYEDLLKGEKPLYNVNRNNKLELIKEGSRGHDLVLAIDINLQLEVEKIIKEELIKAKQEPNTDFLNKAVVLISDPKTGAILTYAAKQIIKVNKEDQVYDYTPFITTSPIVVGSAIKGASMTVGYNMGVIKIGTKMLDECIKIKNTPQKCSWRRGLGVVDDLKALQISSNVYQFKTAMKVGGANYVYNGPLNIDLNAFNIYRNTFGEYGLGVPTGIDLPEESTGYKGTSDVAGHLLDFAIGQYDTYTSLQLLQYINTIANDGVRLKLNLLKEVYQPTKEKKLGQLLYQIEPTILNEVTVADKHLKRIQEGFKAVMTGILGRGLMGDVPKPAGKTGTSQSAYDSNGDGILDKDTTSKVFVGYFPYDQPAMSMVIVTPDISHRYKGSSYNCPINKRISKRVAEKFAELYNLN